MNFKHMVASLRDMGTNGAFIGRLCPPHLGHLFQVDLVTQAFPKQHLIGIGSCNEKISYKHLFNYVDKRDIIRVVHPNARIVGVPDFGNNDMWFAWLDDQLLAMGHDPAQTVFVGGCAEEVDFYFKAGRRVFIVDRFGGITKKVSGTEVRNALIKGRSLKRMLHPDTIPLVQERFQLRYDELRSK